MPGGPSGEERDTHGAPARDRMNAGCIRSYAADPTYAFEVHFLHAAKRIHLGVVVFQTVPEYLLCPQALNLC